jgi:anti-repressor protein
LINLSKSNFGRPTKEYFLTISTAKELSMVERNEKGKQARQYFIKCEETLKKVLTRDVNYFLENPKEMRDLLLGYNQKVLTLQPKAQAYDLIATADKSDLCISTTAKELQLKPSELFK